MKKNFCFVPDGVKHICNCGGVEIMIDNFGDGLIYRYFGKLAKRWQAVKFTPSGRAYFTIKGKREYLSEYFRVNY